MSTAISYVSESTDHYLSLHDGDLSVDEIFEKEKEAMEFEWGCLYIQNIESTNLSDKEMDKLGKKIHKDQNL